MLRKDAFKYFESAPFEPDATSAVSITARIRAPLSIAPLIICEFVREIDGIRRIQGTAMRFGMQRRWLARLKSPAGTVREGSDKLNVAGVMRRGFTSAPWRPC